MFVYFGSDPERRPPWPPLWIADQVRNDVTMLRIVFTLTLVLSHQGRGGLVVVLSCFAPRQTLPPCGYCLKASTSLRHGRRLVVTQRGVSLPPCGLTSLRSRCASVCTCSAKAFTPYRSRPDERPAYAGMTVRVSCRIGTMLGIVLWILG